MLATWWTDTFMPILGLLIPVLLWMAFWLFAVNWSRVWPTLREGAWAPVVLLGLLAAIVWSQLSAAPCCPIVAALPNFWWQLGCVALLIGCALFAGWLQGVLNYAPVEVSVEPPAHHDHGHGHAADHHHDHAEPAAPAHHGHH